MEALTENVHCGAGESHVEIVSALVGFAEKALQKGGERLEKMRQISFLNGLSPDLHDDIRQAIGTLLLIRSGM